ncbi:unnamed protein product [Adineta steineri]|uniref:CRAL-TRIO domain-containing protein n=1 Tax=Adineta steineri TaxID=433720 RepID=A0A813Y1Q4_9BILA|nr:unnamed protein product [Adineta steineri]CAF0873892.1 unnamed protein product [Adineta steineri]CAF3513767.1 unnamed protein product [Adineta steineri]CAF3707266.1 unnamed protein product [Adineta steineri]
MMTSIGLLFDLNQLNEEQQKKFQIVYDELKPKFTSYLDYKLNLPLKTPLNREEEENEWHYELHRFLRARKWNVEHTIKSLHEFLQWRVDNQVDSILEDEVVIQRTELLRKILPNVNHGYTKDDRPLYIEKSGIIYVDKILSEFTTEQLLQCHIYSLELNCQRAKERSRQIGKHVESFTIVSDLQGCNMNIRKIFAPYKQSLYIDNNYYPERLGQMIFINPPSVFPVLWSIVKHWLDPVTKTKIIVVKKGPEAINTLLQYIDSDQLPIEYGGSCQSCPNAPNCISVYDWSKDCISEKSEKK